MWWALGESVKMTDSFSDAGKQALRVSALQPTAGSGVIHGDAESV
jgi:hypothetical protein